MREITQKEKILDLYNSIQNAHCLLFVMSTKLNRWEVKSDREFFTKNNLKLYKTNNFRGREIFNNFPFIKILSQAIQGPFFIAYTDKQKDYSKLHEFFDFSTKHMKILLAIQNNILFSKKRAFMSKNLENKNVLAWPLNVNNTYFLLKNVFLFLVTVIKFQKIK